MRKSYQTLRTSLATVAMATLGFAHVDVAAPVGGEKLNSGSAFTIKWTADDHDCVYNLYHSADSGKTWQTVVLNLPKAARQYDWTVPAKATTKGMIRVFQDNATGSDLEGKSKAFTIRASTGIEGAPTEAEKVSLRSQAGRVEVAFEIARPMEVALQGFDAQGRLVVVLTEGRREGGRHRISFFSTRLQAAGPVVFRMALGDRIHVFNLAGVH